MTEAKTIKLIEDLGKSVKQLNDTVNDMRVDIYGDKGRKIVGLLAKQERDDHAHEEFLNEVRSINQSMETIHRDIKNEVDTKFERLLNLIAEISVWKETLQATPARIAKYVGVLVAFLTGVVTIVNLSWSFVKKLLTYFGI